MTKKRRSHGEGAVYRRSDGRWAAAFELPGGGRRRRKTVYGKTRAECVAKLREAQRRHEAGIGGADERLTMETYLERYALEVLPKPRMKPSTAQQYRYMLMRYVVPYIGGVRLTQLKPQHIDEMQRRLQAEGRKDATIRYARNVLSGALEHAVRMELIERNPVTRVEAPAKPRPRTNDTLAPDEAHALLRAAEGHRLEALIALALALGLRRGEVLALQWSDVDMRGGTVTVRGTLKRPTGGGWIIDRPKTAESIATIPIPKFCVDLLERHRDRQAEERLLAGGSWPSSDFVFTTRSGTPLDPSNLLRQYRALCRSAGIEERRFHALRHSAATLMFEQHVPIEIISKTLRHSSLSVTADIYVALRPEIMRAGADAMDGLLGEAI